MAWRVDIGICNRATGGKADISSDSESSLDSVSESESDEEGGPGSEAPTSAQAATADKVSVTALSVIYPSPFHANHPDLGATLSMI